jgi:hypothetical protein
VNYQLGLTDDYNSIKIKDKDGTNIPDFGNIKAQPRVWSVTAAYLF